MASRQGPCRIAIKPNQNADFRLIISRSQPFAADQDATVTEFKVIDAFTQILAKLPLEGNELLEPDLLAAATRRVVAKSICSRSSQEPAVLLALDQLAGWATRLYEGKPISAAIGFGAKPVSGRIKVSFSQIREEDFCAVLSNGNDTMIVCDYNGHLKGYEALAKPRKAPSFAPYRLSAIASWARNGRLAMVLNRSGEILIFRDQQLIFVRRRGKWSFLAHLPAISQMRTPQDRNLRRAIYESALDASFARTGACLGLVTSANAAKRWRRTATKTSDHLTSKKSAKAQALVRIVKQRTFDSLDRRLRQELLASCVRQVQQNGLSGWWVRCG
jgi:hypothetical protein